MLIPRYSIRWLLGLMTVCGVFFLVLSFAARGQHWAIAVSAAVASLLVVFGLYGGFFALTMIAAGFVKLLKPRPMPLSPFATQMPAPELMSPDEVE